VTTTVAIPGGDPVLAAWGELVTALEQNQHCLAQTRRKGEELARRRASASGWSEVLLSEESPRLAEAVNESLQRLAEANSQYRLAAARALHDEGITMEAIGKLLGVSRQRISHMLQVSPEENRLG
jgi:DNA-directed RNA polymerase sigma subunit (sigma70/sigma32)